ncbi:MAG: DUF1134 domain-containing protein [Hyphomicrobiaceae bacterium]
MPTLNFSSKRLALSGAVVAAVVLFAAPAMAQRNDAYRPPADMPYETQPGQGGSGRFGGQGYGGGQSSGGQGADSAYGAPAAPPSQGGGYGQNTYGQPQTYGQQAASPPYEPQPPYQGQNGGYGGNGSYAANNSGYGGAPRDDGYRAPPQSGGYGAPYSPPPAYDQAPPPQQRYQSTDPNSPTRGYYSEGEIADKGRGFFGSITQGLASAIEYTFRKAGRPNGYILGEDGGGAFFAGLRYGEGTLFTKDAGDHRVFWQGPSLGYDMGGEGSKVMVLAYDLKSPDEIYERFGGVEGSAYLVGGVSVQFQKNNDITLAVIRSGVGLRLGANVGYLKYTRRPTWNPF